MKLDFSTDCELIALGYFLHQRGLLKTGDIDEINDILSRPAGDMDVHAYSFKLMLGLGCERITFFDGPLVTGPEPFGSWLEALSKRDPLANDDDYYYREMHRAACQGLTAIGEVYRQHQDRFAHEQRRVSQDDVIDLLGDPRNIFTAEVDTSRLIVGAASGTVRPGRYYAYDMDNGAYETGSSFFADRAGTLSLLGWRLPA